MTTMTNSVSLFLKDELSRRQSKNAGYSLRAFAKYLGLSSSFMSKVLNGKKNLSGERLRALAVRLNVEDHVIEKLISDFPASKSSHLEFELLAVDQFRYISDWHHFAILEAMTLENCKASADWFAERLSISKDRAQSALDRLERLGFLQKNATGTFTGVVKNNTTLGSIPPSSANTEHERQLLTKALEALDQFPTTHRSQTSMTMAIPASRLPEAKEKIKKFQRELSSSLQRKGPRDSVYQLAIAFFPLTKTNPNKGKIK